MSSSVSWGLAAVDVGLSDLLLPFAAVMSFFLVKSEKAETLVLQRKAGFVVPTSAPHSMRSNTRETLKLLNGIPVCADSF